jgi:hypothetical protein
VRSYRAGPVEPSVSIFGGPRAYTHDGRVEPGDGG